MNTAKKRRQVKGRNENGRFLSMPHCVMNSEDYIKLTTKSKVLLFDLAFQYNGKNNGNLTAAFAILKKRGWVREATIFNAIKELMKANMIIRTREGKFQNPHSRCALYALTWKSIDACNGKDLDVAPTTTTTTTTTTTRKFSLENKIR
jgi:hypothetical protein